MKINSAWHITLAGRSLRIDSHSGSASVKDVCVFTKRTGISERVKERTRIMAIKTIPRFIPGFLNNNR